MVSDLLPELHNWKSAVVSELAVIQIAVKASICQKKKKNTKENSHFKMHIFVLFHTVPYIVLLHLRKIRELHRDTCVPLISTWGPRQVWTEGGEQVKERPCEDHDVGGGAKHDD